MNENNPDLRIFALAIKELNNTNGQSAGRFIEHWNEGIEEEVILTMLRAWLKKRENEYDITFANKQS